MCQKELDAGLKTQKEPKYLLARRFLEGFVEIDKKLARKGKCPVKAGQEKEEKMAKPPESFYGITPPTASPRFKRGKIEELKKSVLDALKLTEQEKTAIRIAEKARKLSKEIEIKWRSLPKFNIYHFETFLVDVGVKLSAEHQKYQGFFKLERFNKDPFYFHLVLVGALLKSGQWIDSDLLSEESICSLFAIFGEEWIRIAVMIEDDLNGMEREFLRLYCQEIEKLSSGEQELVKELQKCVEENDALKGKVASYEHLLQKTIEFLKSTKGICKSKEIKIFREALEERLRKIKDGSEINSEASKAPSVIIDPSLS